MIDAHCHLHASPDFQPERPQILADFDESLRPKMLQLSRENTHTYCVVGTHPWQAALENPSDWIEKMDLNFIEENGIVGIGEIGLDYFRALVETDRAVQLELLQTQLDIAANLKLPVVLHCVKAHQELLSALSNFAFEGMIHGFRSSYEIGKRYVDLGFLVSIGHAIHATTGTKLRDCVRRIGVEHIVVESDAHQLPDAALDKTLQTLAEIFKLDIESLEMKLDRNLERVFSKVEL